MLNPRIQGGKPSLLAKKLLPWMRDALRQKGGKETA